MTRLNQRKVVLSQNEMSHVIVDVWAATRLKVPLITQEKVGAASCVKPLSVSKLDVPIICLQIAALCDCNYRRSG